MSERWHTELTRQGAQFSDGRVDSFATDLASSFAALKDAAIVCDLSHHGVVSVTGDDAAAFLQGQFCNDVTALGEGAAQWNGWCSPKGRLLVTFLAWSDKHEFQLLMPHSLQAAILKRLRMFVLRSKVKLADVNDQWVRFGVAGPNAETLLRNAVGAVPDAPMSTLHSDGARIIKLSTDRYIVVANADKAISLWRALIGTAVPVGAQIWDWLSIQQGIVTVLPETQDAFVPQMANFELAGGVSFKKGCYPGQEIVARTQYRGILKRRMVLAHISSAATPMPGEKLFSATFGDQVAGEIANAAPSPGGGFDMLVVAQIGAINDNNLTYPVAGATVVEMRPLPYSVPLPTLT